MALRSDLLKFSEALWRHGPVMESNPDPMMAPLLNLLAGLLETAPAGTPLGRVLEPVLAHLPAGAFSAPEVRRLAAAAGRCEEGLLRAKADHVATRLRRMAKALTERQERADPASQVRLEEVAEKLLSKHRRELVLFLLEREGYAAGERDVIGHLWPAERGNKTPTQDARNRLSKLMYDTNRALEDLDVGAFQIRRGKGQTLRLEMERTLE
jgi:hypothetical protein